MAVMFAVGAAMWRHRQSHHKPGGEGANGRVENRMPSADVEADATFELGHLASLRVLHDRTAEESARNQAIDRLRDLAWSGLTQELVAIATAPNEGERMRSFAMQHAGLLLRDGNPSVPLESLLADGLGDQAPKVKREAFEALCRLNHPAVRGMLALDIDHPHLDGLRDLVIHTWLDRGERGRAAELRPLLYSPDEVVRVAAIFVLGQWRDEASRPGFREAVEAPKARIRSAGEFALRTLDGPPPPAGPIAR